MITVDLEKKLMNEHKQVFTPKELLQIKEYEQLGELVDNDALQRVGIVGAAEEGKYKAANLVTIKKRLSKFDQERVFHKSQIKSICEKYYLKFLSPKHYKGTVDGDLAYRISNFETAHGVRCSSSNTRIAAPVSSFELQERPKDPLFFYDLGDGYYYLIHKWGNDLSITRRLMPLLTSVFISSAIVWLAIVGVVTGIAALIGGTGAAITTFLIAGLVCTIGLGFWGLLNVDDTSFDDPLRFLPKNKWNSKFKN